MPQRYPGVYPELFEGLDPAGTRLILQMIGSTHDGHLLPREEVADAVERGKLVLRRLDDRRAALRAARSAELGHPLEDHPVQEHPLEGQTAG